MAKTDQNLKKSEDFIRKVLEENFRQAVKSKDLRAAAEKLCDAMPSNKKAVAYS